MTCSLKRKPHPILPKFLRPIAGQLQHYGRVSYFNKRNVAEIDFILDDKTALEVKQKAIEPDRNKLEKLASNLNITEYFLVSNTPVSMDHVIYPWFF